MLLSIGMIVKNEESNLRKCLEGLKPILENVDSELIIADTGSTDNTIAIAKEFTKNVFSIDWHDDFARARNTTVNKAKGKWYMFIDADEYFENTSDIIEFFNSGEYKKYGSATHLMDNITKDGGSGLLLKASRLYRKDKDTRFVGKIHEHIPAKQPQKELKSLSFHTGYDFDDSEEEQAARERKHERNLKPLLDEYRKNPKDVRTIMHVAKQYNFIRDFETAKEYIDIGYQLCPKDNLIYQYYRKEIVMYYMRMGMYEKGIEEIKKYFEDADKLYATAIDMQLHEAKGYELLKMPKEAKEAREKVLHLLDEYDKGNIDASDVQYNPSESLSPKTRTYVKIQILNYYLEADEYDEAIKFAESNGYSRSEVIFIYIKRMAGLCRYNRVPKFYHYITDTYSSDSKEHKDCIDAIENLSTEREVKREIAEAMSENLQSYSADDYINLQKLRSLSFDDGNEEVYEILSYFINSPKVYGPLYADAIATAVRHDVDFSLFAEKIPLDMFMDFIGRMIAVNSDVLDVFISFAGKSVWLDTCKSIKTGFFVYILSRTLLDKSGDASNSIRVSLFEIYIKLYCRYLRQIYKDDVFEEVSIEVLPHAGAFAIYAGKAYELKDQGDYSGFISGIKAALSVDGSMKDIVLTVMNQLKQDIGGEPKQTEASQLEKESASLKEIVIKLIKAGNLTKAKSIIASYEQINPSDPDIARLYKILNSTDIAGN